MFRGTLLLIAVGAGCAEKTEPTEDTYVLDGLEEFAPPVTGWDPMIVEAAVALEKRTLTGELVDRYEDEWLVEPVIVDAAGAEVPLEPMVYGGETWGWRAEAPMAPGDYTLVGVVEFPDDALDEPFEVISAGQTAPDARERLAPGVYEMVDEPDIAPGLSDFMWEYIGDVYLEVLEVQEEAFLGRIVMETDDGDCTVLQDHFDLTETGDASWSTARLQVSSETPPTVLHDAWLHLGFSEDTTAAAGVEGGTLLDTRGIDADQGDPPGSLCSMLHGFGQVCLPCPDDGAEYCLDVQGYRGEMALSEVVFEQTLPFCGADLSDIDGPDITIEWDFDIDCGCAHGAPGGGLAGFLLAGLAGLVRRRPAGPSPTSPS